MNWNQFGYYKVAAIAMQVKVTAIEHNVQEIIRLAKIGHDDEHFISLFPEMALTGYSCGDYLHHAAILGKLKTALVKICQETRDFNNIIVFGMPWQATLNSKLYNVAVIIYRGTILGIVPKLFLPNYKEFNEARWFSSGKNVNYYEEIATAQVLFSPRQLFRVAGCTFAIEICEDLWATIPPSSYLALNGAEIILNLSASNEVIGKADYRLELVKQQSGRLSCAYVYASSGVFESSQEVIFGGHCIIAENGKILAHNDCCSFSDNNMITAIIDLDYLRQERVKYQVSGDNDVVAVDTAVANTATVNAAISGNPIATVNAVTISRYTYNQQYVAAGYQLTNNTRNYSAMPFLPENATQRERQLQEVFTLLSSALARRLSSLTSKKMVVGLSGGLDSTLAALIAIQALTILKLPKTNLIAISMPGFGTSTITKALAKQLANHLGVTFKEIPINELAALHLQAVSHGGELDITYQNTQARIRSQILFDSANMAMAMVIGTADLSELALGFCTYAGDQMAHYAINSSIPKTLIPHLLNYYSRTFDNGIDDIIKQILALDISPELLPPNSLGVISQKTETIIGPYELNDFFLYHYLRNCFSYDKIAALTLKVFVPKYEEEFILNWLQRFWQQIAVSQFKRNSMPPSPKIGTVNLNAHISWRAPDDIIN